MTQSKEQLGFEELAEEHAHLRKHLSEMEAIIAARSARPSSVRDAVEDLVDHLAEHFHLEERDGYFRRVRQMAPRLEHRADELVAQHPLLLREAKRLCDVPPDPFGGVAWEEFAHDFRAFAQKLTDHESGEHQMLQDAYNQDIGAAD